MANTYFQFKQFTIHQDRSAMKVTTDACLFGAWVSQQVKSEKSKVKNALDIGTGTGLLALMFLQKNPDTVTDAIEIDEAAFEQAKENADASLWKDKINVIHNDVKNLSTVNKYDIIISNPPFYENELRSPNDKRNVAHHSDDLGLNELLALTKNLLTGNGRFFFLFPFKRKNDIEKAFRLHDIFINQLILVKQSVKHDHFRIMIEGSLQKNETIIKEISIWNDQQQYTNEFIELLKDYYLYL